MKLQTRISCHNEHGSITVDHKPTTAADIDQWNASRFFTGSAYCSVFAAGTETLTIGLQPDLLPHIFYFLEWQKVSNNGCFFQTFHLRTSHPVLIFSKLCLHPSSKISSWFFTTFRPVWRLLVTLPLTLTSNSILFWIFCAEMMDSSYGNGFPPPTHDP